MITLNNIENASGLLTFNNVPTIVSINRGDDYNSIFNARIICTSGIRNPLNLPEYYIKFGDVKINGAIQIKDVDSNMFWIASTYTASNSAGMAYHLCKALKNTRLINDYYIYVDRTGTNSDTVVLLARGRGEKYNMHIETNIGLFDINEDFGKNYSEYGDNTSLSNGDKVLLNLVIDNEQIELSKTFFEKEIFFDISNILFNYTKYGEIKQFDVYVDSINKTGQVYRQGVLNGNSCINGYHSTNGKLFLNDGETVLLNTENENAILYYYDRIVFSLKGNDTATVRYYDSGGHLLLTQEISSMQASRNGIGVFDYPVVQSVNNTSYIEFEVGGKTITFKNIKPIRYGDMTDYENVFFYNSYGGLQCIPFTAGIEMESDNKSNMYKTDTLRLYRDNHISPEMVYNKTSEITVTMKSHYIDKNGRWAYMDLNNSRCAYVVVNGKKRYIDVDNVSFEEVQVGVYQATLNFKYKNV